jgi:hypothetical protein
MKNRTLHRRLTAIEVEFDRAAKAIERERERLSMARTKVSAEETERIYRQYIKQPGDHSFPGKLNHLTLDELTALYLREVRRPASPRPKR